MKKISTLICFFAVFIGCSNNFNEDESIIHHFDNVEIDEIIGKNEKNVNLSFWEEKPMLYYERNIDRIGLGYTIRITWAGDIGMEIRNGDEYIGYLSTLDNSDVKIYLDFIKTLKDSKISEQNIGKDERKGRSFFVYYDKQGNLISEISFINIDEGKLFSFFKNIMLSNITSIRWTQCDNLFRGI